ncbi:FCD domain-containing protein [Arthrobacter sp. UYEF20]|uniref:GntR family transcriptional regulator n=1 Tax=Arthrobacter sp. UYEF20 TaxID=1756363 RepID=UPI0033940325
MNTDPVEVFRARVAACSPRGSCAASQRIGAGTVPPAHLAEPEHLADAADAHTRSGDLELAAEANRRFHEHAADLADNSVMSVTLNQWWDRTTVSTRHTIRTPRRVEEVDHEHRLILDALGRGDASAARDAAKSHILATRDALIALNETLNEGDRP